METVGSPIAATLGEAALLADLRDLRAHVTRDRKRAFYQHVTLLWAISRARAGQPRMVPYKSAAPELRRFLESFRLDASAPSPANPWVALRRSVWWELNVPVDGAVNYKDASRLDLSAGLCRTAYDRIVADTEFTAQAVTTLKLVIGDHPALPHLLDQLNLTTLQQNHPASRATGLTVISVPVEAARTERFTSPSADSALQERRRREAALQAQYIAHLTDSGHDVSRRRITIPGGGGDLYTDIHDDTTNEMIEVKSDIDRRTIRLGLGQILDYRRYLDGCSTALLVPARPTDDLIELLQSHHVRTIWQTAHGDFDTKPLGQTNH